MTNFFLEIFSEEIPALMQKAVAENLVRTAFDVFTKNGLIIKEDQLNSFVTPRRLTLYISGLSENQEIAETKKIGPKLNANQKAVDGFLKSLGLTSEAQLQKSDQGENSCYFYLVPATQIKTAQIIQNSLPVILQKTAASWPKIMRFDVGNFKWIRPIRNISCMFGEKVVDVEFAGLISNNLTFTKSKGEIKIDSAENYQKILYDNFVIIDREERKKVITDQIKKIKTSLDLETIDDEEKSALFDEVTGLCEWPTALLASIDEKFMDLPDEVLVLTLKLNQKYFCLKNKNGALVAKFIFVMDALVDDLDRKKIISDNEKLVRARLSDAEFFINEDLKKPLISHFDDLKKIVFHKKLGSVHDKALRLSFLTRFLSIFIPHCDLSLADRAADLCKTDLVTKAVAELPELQGKIGSFYAHKQGEDKKVVAAIYEHYLPLGPTSELPKTPLGIALAIADKMDSVVGFFLANEKPTSSKDPYALRRAVLGVIRISFQYNIAFPIRILVEKSLNAYSSKLTKSLLSEQDGDFYKNKKILIEEVIKFFVERLKAYLKENEMVQPDVVNAVLEEYLANLDAHKYCDILYLAKKTKFLGEFINKDSNRTIIELYKRSANILAIEEKKDKQTYDAKPSRIIMRSKYEILLHRRIKQISKDFKKMVTNGEFDSAFKLLDILQVPLAHFFEHVVVNDSDKALRQNRLMLLAEIRALFSEVADLSKIEIVTDAV